MAASTPPWLLACVAEKEASVPPWVQPVTVLIMPYVRVSLPPWSVNCWIGKPSLQLHKLAGRCSPLSKAGTIPIACTLPSAMFHPFSSKDRRPILWIRQAIPCPLKRVSSNLARSGLFFKVHGSKPVRRSIPFCKSAVGNSVAFAIRSKYCFLTFKLLCSLIAQKLR